MNQKSFEEVIQRFREIDIPETFDIIVAIANGGIVPAGILAQRLELEVHLLKINWRDTSQKPKYNAPKLLAPIDFKYRDQSILLVEDRVKSGTTLTYAMELLKGAKSIKTFAVNGKADYSLYDEACFLFPWIM
ncbi:MAG: phosphoribosyltransferase family protein [Bacteroidota bacterium]|jgi:xanthine phosphoribosyltransferase|nr:phosphoribosyltransferase family protein [Bacteroidota bacterium]HHU96752.1 phosphoribosyltransferase [Petrimonas sp.]